MPELPEVETIARQLAPVLVGRRILSVEILDPKLGRLDVMDLSGGRIEQVRRLGKQVGFGLRLPSAAGEQAPWLCIHLRMTGRLAWEPRADQTARPPLRARIHLDRGALLFRDVRRFGTLTLFEALEEAQPAGMDPLARNCTPARLAGWLGESRMPIKSWLMRQDRLVGLGNIMFPRPCTWPGSIPPGQPVAHATGD